MKSWLPVLGAFFLGAGITWLVKPREIVRETNTNTRIRSSPLVRSPHARKTNPKIGSYLDELASSNDQERGKLRQKATNDQLPDIMNAYMKRVGIAGLSKEDQESFRVFLGKWCDADPDAALAWIDSLESDNDRGKFLLTWIDVEAKKDIQKTLAFIEERGIVFERDGVPHSLKLAIRKGNVEEMLSDLSRIRQKGNDIRFPEPLSLTFSPDYDFHRLAAGLAKIEASRPEGEQSAFVPAFITEWAKRDPQAAWDWLKSRQATDPYNHIKPFLAEYGKTTEAGEIAELAADWEKTNPGAAFSFMNSVHKESVISEYLQKKGAGNREEALRGLVSGAIDTGATLSSFDSHLTEQVIAEMTPEERRTLIPEIVRQKEKEGNRPGGQILYGQEALDQFTAIFTRLGHTKAEAHAMLYGK